MNAESHLDTAAAPSQDMLAQILATVNKMSNQQDSLIAENAGLKSQIISIFQIIMRSLHEDVFLNFSLHLETLQIIEVSYQYSTFLEHRQYTSLLV